MEEKKGLLKLGFVSNLVRNEKKQNCMTDLSLLIGREISLEELDNFIESSGFYIEYINKEGELCNKKQSYSFRFILPWKDTMNKHVYGCFSRDELNHSFTGVRWISVDKEYINPMKYGFIASSSWKKLDEMTGQSLSVYSICRYIMSDIQYYNGAGYTKFSDDTPVTSETAKFIKFTTSLKYNNKNIIGWFTKGEKGTFEGISWGTESDFKTALKLKEQFYAGRLIFSSIDDCNNFMDNLKSKTIDEPWEYKHKKDERFRNPILKSYLQFELDRLFYESETLGYKDKIIYNNTGDKVLFNTNLINKFGFDLIIVGSILEISNKKYITEPEIAPSKIVLKRMGFNSSEPMPPTFFKDINEIIFHSDWEIDQDLARYEHIIEERIERFPEKYRDLSADDLGLKLDSAINFAKRIAQRNYKFIVPMYYPTFKRIQLLMPIYLATSYTSHPDFALVLTPHAQEKLYTPETILGLDEVYQDARLIAKPEESWLNPEIIE